MLLCDDLEGFTAFQTNDGGFLDGFFGIKDRTAGNFAVLTLAIAGHGHNAVSDRFDHGQDFVLGHGPGPSLSFHNIQSRCHCFIFIHDIPLTTMLAMIMVMKTTYQSILTQLVMPLKGQRINRGRRARRIFIICPIGVYIPREAEADLKLTEVLRQALDTWEEKNSKL